MSTNLKKSLWLELKQLNMKYAAINEYSQNIQPFIQYLGMNWDKIASAQTLPDMVHRR